MSESAETKTGACLCGRVQFKIEGEAASPLWCTVCHCLNCKRRSGSTVYTAAICPKNGFVITQGEDALSHYSDTMTDSGQELVRSWCSNCGSNLFNFTALNPDIVSISAGAFDDTEWFKPTLEQYCIHRSGFLEKAKGVEKRYTESIAGEMEAEGESEKPE